MTFTAVSTSQVDFDAWIKQTQQTQASLGDTEYESLSRPSKDHAATAYSSYKLGLYDRIIGKYMTPKPKGEATHKAVHESAH